MELQELTIISGTVLSLIYQNDESGYTVLRLLQDSLEEITAVGCMPFLCKGEIVRLFGIWTTHISYGDQFSVVQFERCIPADEEGILSYLSGGAVKGIGPKTAERIVRRFGTESLYIISTDPEKLTEVKGITLQKAILIKQEYNRRASLSVLTDFIVTNALPVQLAFRLYRQYGEFAFEELKKNPYLICSDFLGGDFSSADRIAESFGINGDDFVRVDAGILFELFYNLQNGHAFIPREKLIQASCSLLSVEHEAVEIGLDRLSCTGQIIIEEICLENAVYLSGMFATESAVARKIRELSGIHMNDSRVAKEAVTKVEKKTGIQYAKEQKEALNACAHNSVTVLTGGPGTGKTTAVRGMLELFDLLHLETSLCAPTGLAAKRLSELCGRDASTVHRLLEANFSQEENKMTFQKNEKNQLNAKAVIIDESSMLDITLAAALLNAIKPGTKLVFVGDADQLPSVGPGNFLRDLIASNLVPTIKLTKIFRQASTSDIILNAHRINRGESPDLEKNNGDFFFVSRRTPEALMNTVRELCLKRIPESFGYKRDTIQVICASRIGDSGTNALNQALQEVLNPPSAQKQELIFGSIIFREGDRVIQVKNDYNLIWRRDDTGEVGTGIFNGDIGKVVKIDQKIQMATVLFDDKTVDFPFSELGKLELSYAVTAHKAQGSEFDAVVLCLMRVPRRLMMRSILYTAVTRAKKLLVIIGERETVEFMVKSDQKAKRYSALRARLSED
ncbi:MAG: ATP-dependent RecD-like DNA helicase [Clostridiales bacterium]|nr:ATP-dependent RecD-like DNA helicase [Clostridiales bacterium]